MTETAQMHQPAAMRTHAGRAFARFQADAASTAGPSRTRLVDTHGLQIVRVHGRAEAGIHAYPQYEQEQSLEPKGLRKAVHRLYVCRAAAVYTYKQRQLGQPGYLVVDACSLKDVYTYKQLPARAARRLVLAKGHRPPPTVYTHKRPRRTEPRPERGSVRLGPENRRTTMT